MLGYLHILTAAIAASLIRGEKGKTLHYQLEKTKLYVIDKGEVKDSYGNHTVGYGTLIRSFSWLVL